MNYTQNQINTLSAASTLLDYLSNLLRLMSDTSKSMAEIYKRCQKDGWSEADKLLFESDELALKAYKLKYQEANKMHSDLYRWMHD
ncbi:hypothetical protein H6G27_34260 [Nostoc linckia FACHB-104]|nr:hypothetical protein [Nostoc linckia FACHB-104]